MGPVYELQLQQTTVELFDEIELQADLRVLKSLTLNKIQSKSAFPILEIPSSAHKIEEDGLIESQLQIGLLPISSQLAGFGEISHGITLKRNFPAGAPNAVLPPGNGAILNEYQAVWRSFVAKQVVPIGGKSKLEQP